MHLIDNPRRRENVPGIYRLQSFFDRPENTNAPEKCEVQAITRS
jgi:hypothetical protein